MIASRVALVTGAGRGLGRAIATAFAQKGYAVAINYSRSAADAETLCAAIVAAGGRALVLKADVAVSAEVKTMMERLGREWGRLDVLINNAGRSKEQSIAGMTDDQWRDVVSVTMDGAFYCTRAAIPLLRDAKDGAIVNISSYLASRPARGTANYCSAKAGLIALTKCTAIEEGRFNIRANAFLPGFHLTDMNRATWSMFEKEIRAQHMLSFLPVREQMAEFVVTISELKTVTGQVFAFESRFL